MIDAIEVEDFCQFKHFKLSLKRRGLLWLSGENNDTESAVSNGSGKSNLFRAIGWTIWGECVDGFSGDEVIRHGARCARGIVSLDGGWKIIRERRKGAPRLFLRLEEKDQPGASKEIQLRINELIGMDFDTFRNTSLYGGGGDHRFIHPSTKDSDRKEVLHGILRTGVYGLAHEYVKKKALGLKSQIIDLSIQIKALEVRIEERDPSHLIARSKGWEESRSLRASEYKREALEDAKRARALTRSAPDTSKLERDVAEIEATERRLAEATARFDEISSKIKVATKDCDNRYKAAWTEGENVKSLSEHIRELSGERCPTCSSPMSKGEAAEHLAKLQTNLINAQSKLSALDKESAKAQANVESLERSLQLANKRVRNMGATLRTLEYSRAALAEARSVKFRVSGLVSSARASMRRSLALKKEENPYTSQIIEANKAIDAYKKQLKSKEGESGEHTTLLAHYDFWVRGFGQTGLPSFVLDSTMPLLTERTNKYLETLSDGDITMSFSTQRELKSSKGDFRDNIDIQWEIEGIGNHAPSNGQFKKMEIAVNFALMDLVAMSEGAAPDLLLLDECLDGLDAEGRNRVLQLLHKMRKARGTIIVISHDPGMGELFEHSIHVVKRGGVSEIVEA